MANEVGGSGVVTDQVGGTASGSTSTPDSTQTSTGSTNVSAGNPNPDIKSGQDTWARERAGLIAETQKERAARQTALKDLQERESRLAERDRQIAALTNSKIPTKAELDEQEIRAHIEALYPGLKGLTPEVLEELQELRTQGQQMQSFTERQMTKHSRQMLASVHKGVAEQLGGGELTPSQIRKINAAYIAEAENPEFLERHDNGDPKLVEEFVKSYLDDFVEPIRRKVTATEVNRNRNVPFGRDRSLPLQGGKPVDVTDPKAIEDILVKGFLDKGGQFTGRR